MTVSLPILPVKLIVILPRFPSRFESSSHAFFTVMSTFFFQTAYRSWYGSFSSAATYPTVLSAEAVLSMNVFDTGSYASINERFSNTFPWLLLFPVAKLPESVESTLAHPWKVYPSGAVGALWIFAASLIASCVTVTSVSSLITVLFLSGTLSSSALSG